MKKPNNNAPSSVFNKNNKNKKPEKIKKIQEYINPRYINTKNYTANENINMYYNPLYRMRVYSDILRGKIKVKDENKQPNSKEQLNEEKKEPKETEDELNYQISEKDIEIDKNKKALNLEPKSDEPVIYMKNNNKISEIKDIKFQKDKKPLKKKIFIIILMILILGVSISLILYFLLRKKEKPNQIESEHLISGLTYKKNQILRFQNIKTTKILYDFGNMTTPNASKIFKEYFDFVLGINDQEKKIENNIEKDTFSGFIFLENYMIDNETHKMFLQNSSLFENTNLRNLQEKKYFNFSLDDMDNYCCIDNGTFPIMKFDFYRNGKIIKIYKPKNLITLFDKKLTEILEKIIPKISINDFNDTYKNISEALQNEYEKIKNNNINEEGNDDDKEENEGSENIEDLENENDNEDEEDNLVENEENDRLRRLKKNKKVKRIKIKLRNLDDELDNENENEESDILENTSNVTQIDDDTIAEEFNTQNDFNVNMFNNELIEGEKSNETLNNTNLNYYSHSMIRNDYMEFKGSQQNTTINTLINENDQSLKEVHYIHKGKLVNDTNFKEELENDRQKSCSNDNLLDCNDLIDDNYENIIDSHFKSIDYEINEDIISTGNFINNNIINKLNNYFNLYANDLIINENYKKANSTQRILNEFTDYFLANKFDFEDVEIEIGEDKKEKKVKRNLEESNEYYGMKNMEYVKDIFNLNILGMQMKLQITDTMIIKEGKSVVKIKLQFAFIKISMTLKTLKTNMHLATRNYNEMGYTELYLINESNNKLQKRNIKYSEIILNLQKNFSNLIINKHDFSDIFKESFNEMYENIKTFTTEIFQEFIEIICRAYDNYTEILNDVKENKHEVFNEIREITKKEYINFINNMLLLVEEFNNKTIIFLKEVDEEVSKIENFQIDLLYDLIDIIYEVKKIFKDFNKNLFLAVEKGIKTFRYDFDDFIHEIIGDLLYLVDFLSINLNKNEILRNGVDDITREEITRKLKDMRNIINVITEHLMNNIDNDYKEEMDESNMNSIKVNSNKKLKEYLEDLEDKSNKIIQDIKNKIAFMNLYELYSGNIDKIEDISTNISYEFVSNLYEDNLKKIYNMKPEYLYENSELVKNKENLYNLVNQIDDNINLEIKEINDYIYSYTNDFKIKRQYIIYYNLYNFRQNFIESSINKLRNKFIKLINDTVLISINATLTKNYNLGIQWLDALVKKLIPLHKRDECLTTFFYSKYSTFVKAFQTFLPNTYSEKGINIYRKNFIKIRNDILKTIRQKLNIRNYYYFNNSIYKDVFYFNEQINNEIEILIKNLEKYFDDEYFDIQIANYIYKFTSESLAGIDKKLYNQFHDLKKKCEKYTDCVRKKTWGDYAWNNKKISHKWRYRFAAYKNNYKSIDKSLNCVQNYVDKGTIQIINEFTKSFSPFLDNYIIEIQNLFDNLYNYTETKLKTNDDLNILLNQYLEILNNSEQIAQNKNELDDNNLNNFLQNINNKIIKVDSDFFENYYLKNFSNYLEYPDEILYKINDLENKIISSSDIIKNQINFMMTIKFLRIKEENYYFIEKMKNFFDKLLELKIKNKNIFEYYKEYRIKENLNDIIGKYNFTKNNITEEYLNEIIYDDKIKNIIHEYKEIIIKIENRINEDWILENCTIINKTINVEDIEDENNLENNQPIETDIICNEYKNKSSLNYSEYNFNVVKVRTGIYYIKYLYENLENLFSEFNFDNLMNINIIKQKDEIINDKNILNLYEKSSEKASEFNKEAENILEEYFDYYEEDLTEIVTNKNDFIENFNKFKKIITFEENNFISDVNNLINDTESKINILLDNYNEALEKQIFLVKKYEKFNFNFTLFQKETNNSLNEIENNFNIILSKIKNNSEDYIFNNIVKTRLEFLNTEKKDYLINIIKNLAKNYEIKPFNLTLDINEKTEKIINGILDNLMFSYIYDYIELYESNRDLYINTILEIVEEKKGKILSKFNNITNDFYEELNDYSTEYINKDYLIEYTNNYTLCTNYSLSSINDLLLRDEKNYNKYTYYLNRVDFCFKYKQEEFNINDIDPVKLNITNKTIIEMIDNISNYDYNNLMNNLSSYNFTEEEEEKFNHIFTVLNEYLNNLCEETSNNKINFINETEIFLDCENNSFYLNYENLIYKDTFDTEISSSIAEIDSQYKNLIYSFYISGQFVENFVILNNYFKLEKYDDIPIVQIKRDLDNFQDMSLYINYKYDKKYNQYIKETLIEFFNISYNEFMNKAIKGDIEDNLIIYIFGKIDINIEYIKQKIKNETAYYTLLLNKTKELGITSKKALVTLYNYINDRVNKTLYYQIEDYISDDIIFFYRENKYLFRNNFINYYDQNSNKMFDINNIFNLESLLPEYILSRDFNKTLDKISEDLWIKSLIEKMNNNIQSKLINISKDISNIIINEQKLINKTLTKVKTAELYESMLLLNEMINNYTILVNEQNNRFKFIVSNASLEKFGIFSNNYLEPPLNEIKEYYDMIQNELLNKINELLNQMKDFYAEIQIKYNITEQMNEIYNIIKNSYENLVNYSDDFIKDINDYDDILVLYTYIDSSTNDLRKLNEYLRNDEKRNLEKIRKVFNLTKNKSKNKITRKLEQKNINSDENKITKYTKKDNSKYRKVLNNNKDNNTSSKKFSHKRKLSTHSNQGAIGLSSLNKECKKFIQILKNFNRTYLTGDYLKIKPNLLKEESKIKKYLINAERTIELSVFRLSTIITEDKIVSLEEMLYFKHNQISSHVNNYMNLTSIQTDNYISLLGNSSLMLENTYNVINKKILLDYKILKEFITSQIKEIKKSIKKEEIDNNEKLFNFFKNEDLYQPVGFIISNKTNLINNSTKKINYSKSNTIKYYQKFFKYYKNKIFNNTDEIIYFEINNIFEESNKYQVNKRRMEENTPSGNVNTGNNANNGGNNGGNSGINNANNGGNNDGNSGNNGENSGNNNGNSGNNNANNGGNKEIQNNEDVDEDDDDDEEIGVGFDFSKGQLKFEYEVCPLEQDFSDLINKILDQFKIPIFPPIELRLHSTVKLGFCIGLEFETSLYDKLKDSPQILLSIDVKEDFEDDEDAEANLDYNDNDDEDDDEDDCEDSKFKIDLYGKGEVSLSVDVGIFGEPPVIISFFAGINGLLGSGRIGCSVELNLNKLSISVDTYYVIQAFCVSFFLKIQIEFSVLIFSFKFEFYIFNIPLFGFKFEKHHIVKKILAKLLYEGFNQNNYNNMRELIYEQ